MWTARELFENLMADIVRSVHRDLGFFRARVSLGYEDKEMLLAGLEVDIYAAQRLEACLIERKLIARKKLRENQVYFGVASAMKVLLALAAQDVGLFRVSDKETVEELALMVGRYLGMDWD